MTKKKTRFNNFAKFLCIYSGIFVVAILVLLIILHGFLKDYEEGIPATTMNHILGEFTVDHVDDLINEETVAYNEFETDSVVSNYVKDKINQSNVYYKKKSGEYSEETPVYIVYADDKPIAQVDLQENGKNHYKFKKWKLGTVSFNSFADTQNKMVLKVPKHSNVSLNGVALGDNYITDHDIEFTPCKNVSNYVTEPTMTEYTVEGLLVEPDISVELNGKQLKVESDKNGYIAKYPEDEDLMDTQKSYIMDIAEYYGKCIINRGDVATLSPKMLGKAREYVNDVGALWAFLYGKTYTYEFRNESISNLVRYSEDCFSCDIYYDLYVDWGNGDKTYNTSMTYTFVKKDGKWYVADFILN